MDEFKIRYFGNGKYSVRMKGMEYYPLSYKEMLRELNDWAITLEKGNGNEYV